MPGVNAAFSPSSTREASRWRWPPPLPLSLSNRSQTSVFKVFHPFDAEIPARYSCNAPTLGSMEMRLSFKTTRRSESAAPALFSPSKASPPVMEPSPITATTLRLEPWMSRATAMPSAAEIDVDAWPTPNVS